MARRSRRACLLLTHEAPFPFAVRATIPEGRPSRKPLTAIVMADGSEALLVCYRCGSNGTTWRLVALARAASITWIVFSASWASTGNGPSARRASRTIA